LLKISQALSHSIVEPTNRLANCIEMSSRFIQLACIISDQLPPSARSRLNGLLQRALENPCVLCDLGKIGLGAPSFLTTIRRRVFAPLNLHVRHEAQAARQNIALRFIHLGWQLCRDVGDQFIRKDCEGRLVPPVCWVVFYAKTFDA
jgi:hypothetical protein